MPRRPKCLLPFVKESELVYIKVWCHKAYRYQLHTALVQTMVSDSLQLRDLSCVLKYHRRTTNHVQQREMKNMVPVSADVLAPNCTRPSLSRHRAKDRVCHAKHYSDVIMGAMASQITSLTIVYSTVYSGTDQRKHQSSASLALVRGIHRSLCAGNSPGTGEFPAQSPVTRKMTSSWFPGSFVGYWHSKWRKI